LCDFFSFRVCFVLFLHIFEANFYLFFKKTTLLPEKAHISIYLIKEKRFCAQKNFCFRFFNRRHFLMFF